MDLADFVAGVALLSPADLRSAQLRKLKALKFAWSKDHAAGHDTFASYVSAIPSSFTQIYFATPALDAHYTAMLAAVVLRRPSCDIVLISIINYLLQVNTYQGRYLRVSWPDTFIFGSGQPVNAAGVAGNVERIACFTVVPEVDREVLVALQNVSLNLATLQPVSIEQLPQVIPAAPARYAGCVAFTDLIGSETEWSHAAAVIEHCAGSHREDTHYLFAGESRAVLELAEVARPLGGRVILKTYAVQSGGVWLSRAVLIISEFNTPPTFPFGQLPCADKITHVDHQGLLAGAAPGLIHRQVHTPELVTQKAPRILSAGAAIRDFQLSTISSTITLAHTVYEIPRGLYIDAQLGPDHSASYVVASADNQVIIEANEPTLLNLSQYAPNGEHHRLVPRRVQAYVEGDCMPLAFSPAILDYHSHFLLQCFPRIRVAEELGLSECKFLAPPNLKTYQRAMLNIAGVSNNRIIDMQPAFSYNCERLLIPNINPAILSPFYASAYDRFTSLQRRGNKDWPSRIIVSRAARSTWRNMVNYDLVAQALVEEFGFTIVAPDKLSLHDELDLFAAAEIVVGAEGAGLYNCIFMPAGSDIICLADEDYVMYVLGAIAEYRNLHVSFVFGESFQADKDWSRREGHADFVLDPERVAACVRRVISARNAQT